VIKEPSDGWDENERREFDDNVDLREEIAGLRDRHAKNTAPDALGALRAGAHDALPEPLQSAASDRLANDAWSRALVEGIEDSPVELSEHDAARLLTRIKGEMAGTQRAAHHAASTSNARAVTGESRWRGGVVWAVAAAASLALITWLAWPAINPSSRESGSADGSRARIETAPGVPGVSAPSGAVAPGSAAGAAPSLPDSPGAPGAPAPVTPTAAGPLAPRGGSVLLLLRKPEATLSLAALTWRGNGSENQLVNDLKVPMDAFRASDFARAASAFSALESKYPDSVEVFFYGGVSQLFLNDPARAAALLERASALADSVFAPRVSWYRAVAATRLDRTADARALLEALCRDNGDYAAQACGALPSFDAASTIEAK
jgi:hypothetical protein